MNKPTPMKADPKYMAEIDTSKGPTSPREHKELENKMGFKYRAATGELIFAMVTCRPDISYAVIKLTQFNNAPAEIHYNAILDIYRYLQATQHEGIQYWRPKKNTQLPDIPPAAAEIEQFDIEIPKEHYNMSSTYGCVDSDWAGNVNTRKSVSGISFILAGAPIVYKTINQKTVALSSTEAEFYALSEAGKLALYIRSILNELHIPQTAATVVYEDNQGCLFMAAAGKPTKKTRHVEIRHYAILDWIDQDLLEIKKIHTNNNCSDTLTKALAKTLFYRHTDTLMGRRKPLT